MHASLAEAAGRQELPDDYTDVTEGFLSSLKRRLKRKLLGNFKHAYVDVLSRQQSAFNQHILAAVHELAECCARLDHAAQLWEAPPANASPATRTDAGRGAFLVAWIEQLVAAGKADELAAVFQSLQELAAGQTERLAALEERLLRLETQALEEDNISQSQ